MLCCQDTIRQLPKSSLTNGLSSVGHIAKKHSLTIYTPKLAYINMYDTLSYIALMIINYLVDADEPSQTKTYNFRKHEKKHVGCTKW